MVIFFLSASSRGVSFLVLIFGGLCSGCGMACLMFWFDGIEVAWDGCVRVGRSRRGRYFLMFIVLGVCVAKVVCYEWFLLKFLVYGFIDMMHAKYLICIFV